MLLENKALTASTDFVAGIEYKFTATPFAVSLDLKPLIDFNRYGDYQCNIDKSIGVKFAF